ncbi:MAG: hypothetical protein ACYC56_08505 [Candidatus Aquicultor sp.]
MSTVEMAAKSETNTYIDEVSDPLELLVELEKEFIMKEFDEITGLPSAVNASGDNRTPVFKVAAKNGLKISVFTDKLVFSSRGRNTEIPKGKVTGITLKKTLAETMRFENTLVLDLECGRVVTLRRIPTSKVALLKHAILAHA